MGMVYPSGDLSWMNVCPNCDCSLEKFEVSCHACGQAIASSPAPVVASVAPSRKELKESFQSWLTSGKDSLVKDDLEEAANCLREAVKRSRTLDDAEKFEQEARLLLAEALERLGKIPEAADQYRIVSQLTADLRTRENWLKRSQDLLAASSTLPFDQLFRKEDFRPLLEEERRYVPLYCDGCKRLFAEGEAYGFRRSNSDVVRCWCGIEERPLAKQDARHFRALEEGQTQSAGQRKIAVSVAGREIAGGKKRSLACLMAVLTGWCGGHKFYLGDRVVGMIYLVWSWTLVPWLVSLYEAIILSQMSLVTFNMTYNLDLVLEQLPEEATPMSRIDMFSLDRGEGLPEETEEEVGS